jgi:diketogulonate reductase-like aldo/keto reductase
MARITRRDLVGAALALPAMGAVAQTAQPALHARRLPGGESMPMVGLGSWITFNVGDDAAARRACGDVIAAFADGGGRMIDSSPMYGSSQGVIGEGLARLPAARRGAIYAADKVWTSGDGAAQAEASRRLWQVARFDLLQVHNLVAWEKQLALLQEMKRAGRVRHVGITTSEGRRHREFERIMATQPLDFVQLSYNLLDREVEQRLLPLAAERGIGVIVNRPFQQGMLLQRLARHPLPGWATGELQCDGWAQVALKFVIGHPAVTCAIPATSRVDHVRQNLGAARGPLPDAALRRRMAEHVAAL